MGGVSQVGLSGSHSGHGAEESRPVPTVIPVLTLLWLSKPGLGCAGRGWWDCAVTAAATLQHGVGSAVCESKHQEGNDGVLFLPEALIFHGTPFERPHFTRSTRRRHGNKNFRYTERPVNLWEDPKLGGHPVPALGCRSWAGICVAAAQLPLQPDAPQLGSRAVSHSFMQDLAQENPLLETW